MKKILFLSLGALFCMFLSGCSSDETVQPSTDIPDGVQFYGVNVPAFDADGMRCYIDKEGSKSTIWEVNDRVGIFATSGPQQSQVVYVVEETSEGGKKAHFLPGSYWFKPGYSFVSYYPLQEQYLEYVDDIPFSLSGQYQKSNNDATAQSELLVNITSETEPDATGKQILFQYSRLWAMAWTDLTMPYEGPWMKFTLKAPAGKSFHENITYNFKEGGYTYLDDLDEVSMTLGEDGNGIKLNSDDLHLKLFMLVCPTDMTGEDITVEVMDYKGNTYSCVISGKIPGGGDKPFFKSNANFKMEGSPVNTAAQFDITGKGSDFNDQGTK